MLKRKIKLILAILALGLVLSACGQKGPLRHPDQEPAATMRGGL